VIKRIALLLTVVGALACASAAIAASEEWAGRFEQGSGAVAFKLTIPAKGEQRKVKAWEWSDFKLRCRNGKHKYDGRFTSAVKPVAVDPSLRDFKIKAVNSWGGKAIVKGTFDETYATAVGTFRVRGRTAVGRRCRGESGWTASGPPE
jgi:hypothetical protein